MDQRLEEKLKCYMKDCGCSTSQTAEYLALADGGCTQNQIYFLKRRRNQLLHQLHTVTRQIDCIDYIIHELEETKNG